MRRNKVRWGIILGLFAGAMFLGVYLFRAFWPDGQEPGSSRRHHPQATAPGANGVALAPEGTSRPSHITSSPEELDLPMPESDMALARFYGGKGTPRIEDAAVAWGIETERYIQYLKQESLELSAYRTYGTSELIDVLGSFPILREQSASIVGLLGRTRRVSKLLRQIDAASNEGSTAQVVASLSNVVDKVLAERTDVYGKLKCIAAEHPDWFQPGAKMTKEQWTLADLINGHAYSASGPPDSLIPVSLRGTALAATANVFLLGMTEHPDALKTILRIADYDDSSLRQSVSSSPAFQPVGPRNSYVIADALDRILCAAAAGNISGPAGQQAKDYVAWRQTQQWGDRQEMSVYAYDSPQENPFSPRGMITQTIISPPAVERKLSLPLTFGRGEYDEGAPPQAAEIINWARKVEQTLNVKSP